MTAIDLYTSTDDLIEIAYLVTACGDGYHTPREITVDIIAIMVNGRTVSEIESNLALLDALCCTMAELDDALENYILDRHAPDFDPSYDHDEDYSLA
jgi:hypothetical protein